MFKSITRFFLLLSALVIIAGSAGYLSYVVTSNMLNAKVPDKQAVSRSSVQINSQNSNYQSESSYADKTPVHFEFYVVRLEGNTLGIYASADGKEEFLYNESIYTNDLSPSDVEMLQNGVKLSTSSELTGFIENFTS